MCVICEEYRADNIDAFNCTSRYLDNLLNTYNVYFEQLID